MKKFLSLILALTLVASLFTVNVMAASKAHTVTITADKTTELAAGDIVTIEVAIDNTEALVACQYELTYDATAFTADQTKVSRLEKCIDSAWMTDIKNADGDWAYYLGNPTYNVKNAGKMSFAWGGSEGVEADYAVDNRVIGKFYLTVADGVADGEYTFTLTGNTTDAGENSKADMVVTPVTVTVGAAEEEEVVEVGGTTAAATNGVASEDGSKVYDNAMAVSTAITATTATEIGVLFAPKAWLGDNALEATLDGVAKAAKTGIVGGIATTLKAALKDIPRNLNDTEFVMVTRAYAYDDVTYTYADAVETTMLFTKTAE